MLKQQNSNFSLDTLFYPRSLAVVGASGDPNTISNAGNLFLETLRDFGYQGELYAVGASGGETAGLKIYQKIKDILGDVEYVLAAIPNRFMPQLVEDCGQKNVKVIHLFSSGFGEIEDTVGAGLQQEMLRIAAKYDVRLLGPNCMGVYCPQTGLTFAERFSSVRGHVSYLSQSGGQSMLGVREANGRGIYFSKVVSYGNACDINECDLIEYFAHDPDTEIITAYIEGTNDGERLFSVLKEATSLKPVVVFKCAATGGGTQAAVSHTSAIAGSNTTWDSLLRQTGVIRVYNVKQMFDVVTVLQRCAEPKGLRTLIVGHGGGTCVQATDDCCRAGLTVPLLPAEYRQALRKIYYTDAGNIFKNPVDINPYWGMEFAGAAFKTVVDWPGADIILIPAVPEQNPFMPREIQYQIYVDTFGEWAKMSGKPTVVALSVNTMPGDDGLPERSFKKLLDAGLAVFPSVESAATAVYRVHQYHQWRKKHTPKT
ncbi:MAG: CoA-binding protein [Chloroflexi bacterium]|nr:CoA-binding protein [Chloroflexota bacterium]